MKKVKEEISLKNTKQEILDALNDVLEKEKNAIATKSNPAKEEQEKVIAKAIESSKVNVEQKIFSEELNNKFKDLEKAIQAEEEKLEALYGIEKELQRVTLVINAGKDAIAQTEFEKRNKVEELNCAIEDLETRYKEKNLELQQEYETTSRKLKLERERENEAYSYKQKRERDIENNNWADEKATREEALSKTEAETKRLLGEATEKVDYIKGLETKVNEIPKTLQKEYERGAEEATRALEKEHEHKVALSEKDYESTAVRLNDKVEALTAELAKSAKLNVTLQEKLDHAYVEIKELATKTVEASSGVKIIGNSSSENK
ncbi:MAG: hypothetical protein LBT22_07935 [Peptococcaceae bacterium]|jgi:hypothetical protein|nr:hypothetical protein [Peptococcaceae bacterium]